jgi:RNA polymerase sigma factor (sigma-70 family)
MSMQDTLRRIARQPEPLANHPERLDSRLDACVATVETAYGVIASEQYAVAFVRRYQYDEQELKHIFGGDRDLEDLQHEMLDVCYKAAKAFVKQGGDGNWKAYLSHCLKKRLWDLSTRDARRNNQTCVYLFDKESYTDACYTATHDAYTGEKISDPRTLKSLVVEDVYQGLFDRNQARQFLESLTQRQRAIILLRWDHSPYNQSDKVSLSDIAKQLGVSDRTIDNEILRIQRAFADYAQEHHEEDWLCYLKRLQKKRETAR